MKFFQMTYANVGGNKFAWAAGFDPPPGGVPFLNPISLEVMKAVWALSEKLIPGVRVEGYGKAHQWPDFMGHGGGDPSYFVSERVVGSLQNAGIPIARLTEMPLADIQSARLRKVPPPTYYALEMKPGIAWDYEASGIPFDAKGKPIFDHMKPPKWTAKLASWNGTPLFGRPNIWNQPTTSLLCTERIRDLAEKDGWTNVEFKPIPFV